MSKWDRSDRGLNRLAIYIYLSISIPALIILSFLTAPFQVIDEPSHYFRAIAVSHGEFFPLVAKTRDSAGGLVESGAVALTTSYEDIRKSDTNAGHRFTFSNVMHTYSVNSSKYKTYVAFSNTAIYFPAAHVVQAAAVFIARTLGLKPLAWLYIGRLVNSALFLFISCAAIKMLRGFEIFSVTFLLLPMVLFEAASFSADPLIMSCSILFFGLIKRLLDKEALGPLPYALFAICFIYICLGKYAYVPFCALPLTISVMTRRPLRDSVGLGLLALSTIAIWAAWAFFIRNDIFNMRDSDGVADAHAQIAFISHHPLKAIGTLMHSMRFERSYLLQTMVGSRLGWLNVNVPIWSVNLSLSLIFISMLARTAPTFADIQLSAVIMCCMAVCVFLIYVLIYIQFNPVGRPYVEGVQGRYFLPILVLVPLTFRGIVVSQSRARLLLYAFPLVSAAPILVTLWTLLHRYWLP